MLIFEFKPPFTQENIDSVEARILETIPAYEVPWQEYVIDCWHSLIEYAIGHKHQTANFSLNIAPFIPKYTHSEGRHLFSKSNIWVKVRVKGGFLSMLKSSYMATHEGIAKIDWKRKTSELMAKGTVKLGGAAINHVLSSHPHLALLQKVLEEGTEKLGEEWVNSMRRRELNRRSDRMKGFNFYAKGIYTRLKDMPLRTLNEKIASGEIADFTESIFRALDIDKSGQIDWDEFNVFWSDILNLHQWEGKCFFEKVAPRGQMTESMFAPVFTTVMRARLIAVEKARLHPISGKMEKAKELMQTFQGKNCFQYHSLMSSASEFHSFAASVFSQINSNGSGTITFPDFVTFMCHQGTSDYFAETQFSTLAPGGVLSLQNFTSFLHRFIVDEHAAITDGKHAMWTAVVAEWKKKPSSWHNEVNDEYFLEVANQLFASVSVANSMLNYYQMNYLDAYMHEALPRFQLVEEEKRIRFALFSDEATGTVPVRNYALIVKASFRYMDLLTEHFLAAYECDKSLYQPAKPLSDADITRILQAFYTRFCVGDEIPYKQYVLWLTSTCKSNAHNISTMSRSLCLPLSKILEMSLKIVKEESNDTIVTRCKQQLASVLNVSFASLKAYQYADYLHRRISLEIFLMLFPRQETHSAEVFNTYKGGIAEALHFSIEVVSDLFVRFAHNGSLTVDGLAGIIKVLIQQTVVECSNVELR